MIAQHIWKSVLDSTLTPQVSVETCKLQRNSDVHTVYS